jgi:diacylglycerol kinase (ATP)
MRLQKNRERVEALNSEGFQVSSTSFQNVHIIINPASAGGKTGKMQGQTLRTLEERCGRRYSLCVTQQPGEAGVSARKAIIEGSKLIITIGGDGTIQETVNGFFSNGHPINPSCQLGIINSGTGSGFAQSMGLPPLIDEQIHVIFNGQTRLVDVGRVVFSDNNGLKAERYFVNECQAGIGGAVVQKVQSAQKKLGGKLAFGSSTLAMAFRYPNQPMAVAIDDDFKVRGRFMGVVITNGSYMGGGMNLTPDAEVDDGLFDILLIHGQSIPQRLWNFPKIYSGRHTDSPKFSIYRGERVDISSSRRVLVEADGELLGSLPCTVEMVPSALLVRAAFPETRNKP